MKPEILALCGPSGVGKTTCIKELVNSGHFAYPTPYTDRPLREGETDKISLPKEEFESLAEAGEFCAINEVYGNRYGTPTALIERIISDGKTVIIDFPEDQLEKLNRWRTKHLYLLPPSEEELVGRLIGANRQERIPEALEQLKVEHENILINYNSWETAQRIIEGEI